jgi:LacI family transcriptional regulator
VEDVVRAIVVPRRRLERRFRDRLACGIHEYITKVRIDRIKELLVETSLPMPDICARTGFSSPTLMSRIFRRETDTTPSSYRKTHSMQ